MESNFIDLLVTYYRQLTITKGHINPHLIVDVCTFSLFRDGAADNFPRKAWLNQADHYYHCTCICK